MTWGGVAAGVGALGAGVIGSISAKNAASKSAKGADQAAQLQNQQYQQTRQDLAPYRSVGGQALNVLAATYGYAPYDAQTDASNQAAADPYQTTDASKLVSTGQKSDGGKDIFVDPDTGFGYLIAKNGSNAGAPVPTGQKVTGWPMSNKAAAAMGTVSKAAGTNLLAGKPNYDYFNASPDYNFRLDQGVSALDRSAAARGMVRSGAQTKAVQRFGQDTASTEYGNWFNKQAALAGIGQTATTQTGAFGANAANNIGNAYQNAADTRASGYLAQGNIWGGAAQGIGNAFANYGSRPKPPPFGDGLG